MSKLNLSIFMVSRLHLSGRAVLGMLVLDKPRYLIMWPRKQRWTLRLAALIAIHEQFRTDFPSPDRCVEYNIVVLRGSCVANNVKVEDMLRNANSDVLLRNAAGSGSKEAFDFVLRSLKERPMLPEVRDCAIPYLLNR